MFLTRSNTYYTSSGEQHASKAWYLVLATRDIPTVTGFERATDYRHACATCGKYHHALYAASRKVALSQCGHFMMGTARIGQQSVTISGAFGNDGLPMHMGNALWHTISDSLLPYFTRVPDGIASSYWHSGEDYHAGKSGDYSALKTWAMATLVYPTYVKSGYLPYASHVFDANTSKTYLLGMYRKWQTPSDRARAERLFA